MIEARKIRDSIGEHSPRLLAIRATNPKFIHQETLRHRMIYIEDALRGDPDFSFSVSSARAVPFRKLRDEAFYSHLRAKPVKWGAEQKGMSPADEESPEIIAQAEQIWEEAARDAVRHAERMAVLGRHKSIVNRIIEPYIHVHCLMTATAPGWMNFFGLRLDRAADPTLQALAEAAWVVWNESVPQKLKPGEWHLPYVDLTGIDEKVIWDAADDLRIRDGRAQSECMIDIAKRVSTARSAHLSYTSFATGKRMTVGECLDLHDRLVGGPTIHASPAEHQATPDVWVEESQMWINPLGPITKPAKWDHPELHGNLPGWIQYRKTLPGEAIAPLPEGYELPR